MNLPEILSVFADYAESPTTDPDLVRALNAAMKHLRPKTRTPIPPMSEKRQAEQPTRAEVRKIVLKRDKMCRVCVRLKVDFPYRSTDVHELRNRSQGGDYLNAEECIGVCRIHHNLITDNPEWAHENGFTVWSWEGPGSSKILPRRTA